jgi:hypothetical protein
MLLSPKCTTIVRGGACFVVMVTIHFLAERVDGASVQAATCRGLGSRSKRSATVNIDCSVQTSLGDVTIRTMARFIQGTCGLANIDNDDRIRAEDVTYDNSDGLYPPGTDTVQLALEAAGGGASVAEMTPTVAGTAYGLQDTGTVSNLLGRDVNAAATSATGRYQAQIAGTPQAASYSFAVFDENHCLTDTNTTANNALVAVNNSELSNTQISDSVCEVTNSLLSDTAINNALVHGNAAQLHGGAMVLNCALTVNDSHLKSAQLDQACLHVTGLNAEGIPFEGAVMVGSMTNTAVTTMRESVFIGSNAGAVINQNGQQALYLGNQSIGETTNDREAWISSFDRFFLRTLRNDPAPPDVCFYDPSTSEITYGPAPVAALALKQPTTLGGQFGINSAANSSEVNGRNSFNNYSAAPIQLSGVTAVGNNLYQASTPASNSFSNSIFLGRSHQFTGATTITNSLIAASIVGISSVSKIQDANMVVPRAASLTFGYTGEINGPAFFSSGNIACTQDPLYSTVVSSGGTVNPGANNLVLSSTPVTNSITMNGQGNTLITAAPSAFTYVHPVFSNCTTILGGTSAVSATANLQLVTNHNTLRMPNILTVSGALLAANLTPVFWDTSTGLISPTVSTRASRIWRGTGTTDGAGQVIFTPGGGLAPNTVGYAVNLTVVDNSTTIAYTAQIESLTATQILARVFRSVTVVLASPSMTLAGAGIVLHATMAW